MRTAKNVFLVAMALLPVLYLGGLLLHFNNVRMMFGGLLDSQLGPTMIGIGALLLICIVPLGIRIWRLGRGGDAAPPGSGGTGPAKEGAQSDFDADAALARYLARRDAAPPSDRPLTFGRKQG